MSQAVLAEEEDAHRQRQHGHNAQHDADGKLAREGGAELLAAVAHHAVYAVERVDGLSFKVFVFMRAQRTGDEERHSAAYKHKEKRKSETHGLRLGERQTAHLRRTGEKDDGDGAEDAQHHAESDPRGVLLAHLQKGRGLLHRDRAQGTVIFRARGGLRLFQLVFQ